VARRSLVCDLICLIIILRADWRSRHRTDGKRKKIVVIVATILDLTLSHMSGKIGDRWPLERRIFLGDFIILQDSLTLLL
jgi:hypothetical protein